MKPLRRWEVLISGTCRYIYADRFTMDVEQQLCSFYARDTDLNDGSELLVAQFDMCVVAGVIDMAAVIGKPPRDLRADDAKDRKPRKPRATPAVADVDIETDLPGV